MRLLVTTFNSPDYNMDEAFHFKKAALDSKLLDTDRMSELWSSFPQELGHTAAAPGIRAIERHGARLFSFLSLSLHAGKGWKRLIEPKHLPVLKRWLASLYEEPVDCWVIGGHHDIRYDRPVCWGDDEVADLVGFHIDEQDELCWFGSRTAKAGEDRLERLPMRDARAKLRSVRLMLVLGCNAVPVARFGEHWDKPMAQRWREWLRPTGAKPLIIGWFSTQSMPLNTESLHAAPKFWSSMADLKRELNLGADALKVLCEQYPLRVAQAWGDACYHAFNASKKRSKLWGLKWQGVPPVKKGQFGSGCGAVLPDGSIYHANHKYRGAGAEQPLIHVGDLP
ncbi:hypothetical protein GCM10011487_28630 [Steroidobacter agaridevorans]|uniref:Uncharacterized protein n=1 Tax=Steroidobacter agaridevorans TaxID=2695856 RepID=A0A829YD35_9GAMM|nr:hypothetical protein [Steroidobacter agaridevorans]GFE80863.1 hypothetical protein GCM10011487_28630 [Steroidobacter agaridevorans]